MCVYSLAYSLGREKFLESPVGVEILGTEAAYIFGLGKQGIFSCEGEDCEPIRLKWLNFKYYKRKDRKWGVIPDVFNKIFIFFII